ncbi:MAG: undecaprenyl-diphosphate phosphatase [Firmicutes bacterium]|nr:undecaprenyl-diphosphate phosphatase [Bacillota bacterium]
MTTLQALILGIVQGVAEFLPISSSGHLIVLQRVFGIEEPLVTFDIFVHIGSLVAIVIVFWQDIWTLIKNPFSKMTGLLIIGTLPVVVCGFILYTTGILENNFRSGLWLACAFTVSGLFLVVADKTTNTYKEEKDITYKDALVIGFFQALALPPGITRSGTTIMGGLSRGINRAAAAKFSFMLAIIAIAGAGLLDLVASIRGSEYYEMFADASSIGIVPMVVGFAASLVVGYFSIRLLLELIKKCKLKYFSYYLWVLAAVILLDYFIINRFF